MGSLKQHLLRTVGFALIPAFSFMIALLILPLISAKYGANGWTAVALGQSSGAIASVAVGLTWPIIGGNLIARAAFEDKIEIYVRSVFSRLLVFAFAATVGAIVGALLAPQYRVEAALFAVAVSMNGLSAAWYYSGTGRPLPLLLNEGVVRFAGYALAFVGMLLGAGILWYAISNVLAAIAMFLLNWRTIVRKLRPASFWERLKDAKRTLVSQLFGTTAAVVQALYYFGGPSLFAILAPTHLAAFSGADQLQKSVGNGLGALPTAFVSWVGSASAGNRFRRILTATAFMLITAFGVFVAIAVAGQQVLDFIFSGHLVLHSTDLLILAGALSGTFLVKAVELLVLVPLGRHQIVYEGTLGTSLLGLVLFIILVPAWGLTGGLAVPLIGAGVLSIYYASAIRWRKPSPATTGGTKATPKITELL